MYLVEELGRTANSTGTGWMVITMVLIMTVDFA
jgi:hypothetical protein